MFLFPNLESNWTTTKTVTVCSAPKPYIIPLLPFQAYLQRQQ